MLIFSNASIRRSLLCSRSCRLDRPQDGLQQVVIVARASLYRERFDLGGRNSSLAQSPLHALDNGESIFIFTDQGDTDVRIFCPACQSPPSVLRGSAVAARARAPSSRRARLVVRAALMLEHRARPALHGPARLGISASVFAWLAPPSVGTQLRSHRLGNAALVLVAAPVVGQRVKLRQPLVPLHVPVCLAVRGRSMPARVPFGIPHPIS